MTPYDNVSNSDLEFVFSKQFAHYEQIMIPSSAAFILAESLGWHGYLYLNMMFTYLKLMPPDGLMP